MSISPFNLIVNSGPPKSTSTQANGFNPGSLRRGRFLIGNYNEVGLVFQQDGFSFRK